MPLPMQGDKLFPGLQNIGRGSFGPRGPDRRRGDGALDPSQKRSMSAPRQFSRQRSPFRRAILIKIFAEIFGEMMGKDVDQGAFELLRIGVAEFGLGELLEMLMQKPGVVECLLQDQCFPAWNRGTMAAIDWTRRQLQACRDISLVAAEARGARRTVAAAFLVVLGAS